MDGRNMRIGDFVKDPAQNYIMRVGIDEMRFPELFDGIALTKGFFLKNGYQPDYTTGKEVLYRQDDGATSTAEYRGEGKWFVQVRYGSLKFEGLVYTVHHYQHILSDTLVYWKILV